jgi:hypothetical protein
MWKNSPEFSFKSDSKRPLCTGTKQVVIDKKVLKGCEFKPSVLKKNTAKNQANTRRDITRSADGTFLTWTWSVECKGCVYTGYTGHYTTTDCGHEEKKSTWLRRICPQATKKYTVCRSWFVVPGIDGNLPLFWIFINWLQQYMTKILPAICTPFQKSPLVSLRYVKKDTSVFHDNSIWFWTGVKCWPYWRCPGGGLLERPEFPESGYLLRPTEQAVAAIRRCFDKEIFLLPLADRFFKLALQIGSP